MPDWLWRWYDASYRWFHGVEDLPSEEGSVLRVSVERYRGRRVVLSDGTVIVRGDVVGTIHFHNKVVAAIHDRTTDPARAGILMRRAFERAMGTLAHLSESDPRYRPVKAFRATTILHQGGKRFGFDILPPPSRLFGRIVAAYERSLLARFHPHGVVRARRKRFNEVRVIWISRATLRRRYADRRSSPSGASS